MFGMKILYDVGKTILSFTLLKIYDTGINKQKPV
jgi:hypothetical protein